MGQLELAASDINRAFINIIENACYALQAKQAQTDETFTPTLWVKTSRRSSSVEIQIRDNGLGIEPEIQEKIFQPFFTTKPVGEGTGLGLSITHDIIVGQHQGTLSLATEPGNYTEFIITLPGNGASHTSPLS
ncbi:MAG: ATP-binding protein [Pseudanabaenales cyanobacterium]|nr:ATP-binding protein [Pseudanabaenales cyanobacterium]